MQAQRHKGEEEPGVQGTNAKRGPDQTGGPTVRCPGENLGELISVLLHMLLPTPSLLIRSKGKASEDFVLGSCHF